MFKLAPLESDDEVKLEEVYPDRIFLPGEWPTCQIKECESEVDGYHYVKGVPIGFCSEHYPPVRYVTVFRPRWFWRLFGK